MNYKIISYDRNFDLKTPGIHLRYSKAKEVKKIASDKLKHTHRFKVSFGDQENHVSTVGKEVTEIGAFLFCIENFHQKGYSKLNKAIFSSRVPELWQDIRVNLESTFEFLTKRSINLDFVPFPSKYKEKVVKPKPMEKYDACSLFSDGLDSFVTYIQFRNKGHKIFGANTNHNPKMMNKIEKIEKLIDKPLIHSLNLNKNLPKRAQGELQQTRGFMYLCTAATYAEIHQTNKIIVGECGPVMYQPKLLPSDIVTRTTNPAMLKGAERIFSKVFDTKFKIFTPFENNTKAEIISLLPEQVKKNHMHYFASCLKMAWGNKMCGICYSCLLRKLSGIVACATDNNFKNDILINGAKSPRDIIDLAPFLQFCKNVLIGISNLDFESRNIIEQYKKEDLFRRNSLDALAGLYLLYVKNKTGKNKYATSFIQNCLKDGTVTKDQLDKRIEDVRSHNFPSPNLGIGE